MHRACLFVLLGLELESDYNYDGVDEPCKFDKSKVRAAIRGEDNLRHVGVNFGRWLITGLTFMLAADILGTMVETDWEGIGRLAAVAAIRTFLNFFLERDLREIRDGEPSNEDQPEEAKETE